MRSSAFIVGIFLAGPAFGGYATSEDPAESGDRRMNDAINDYQFAVRDVRTSLRDLGTLLDQCHKNPGELKARLEGLDKRLAIRLTTIQRDRTGASSSIGLGEAIRKQKFGSDYSVAKDASCEGSVRALRGVLTEAQGNLRTAGENAVLVRDQSRDDSGWLGTTLKPEQAKEDPKQCREVLQTVKDKVLGGFEQERKHADDVVNAYASRVQEKSDELGKVPETSYCRTDTAQ